MAEFARLGKGSADLTMERRRLFTFLNAQGNGFYNYNIQLANAGKLFEQYQAAQELQDAQVRKNTEGSLQFDRAVMKLRARLAALTTIILDNLDTMFAANDVENILETDFWNINGDSLNNYDSYFSDMAFFLLEEGYVWETYELINEFEQKEEI